MALFSIMVVEIATGLDAFISQFKIKLLQRFILFAVEVSVFDLLY